MAAWWSLVSVAGRAAGMPVPGLAGKDQSARAGARWRATSTGQQWLQVRPGQAEPGNGSMRAGGDGVERVTQRRPGRPGQRRAGELTYEIPSRCSGAGPLAPGVTGTPSRRMPSARCRHMTPPERQDEGRYRAGSAPGRDDQGWSNHLRAGPAAGKPAPWPAITAMLTIPKA